MNEPAFLYRNVGNKGRRFYDPHASAGGAEKEFTAVSEQSWNHFDTRGFFILYSILPDCQLPRVAKDHAFMLPQVFGRSGFSVIL